MPANETLRVLERVSEEILRATSPADIAQKLAEELPGITRANAVRLYRFNAANKSLEAIPCEKFPAPAAASVEHPPEGLISAVVRCYQERAPVHINDARRDIDVNPTHQKGFPRSAFLAPVLFGAEALGVIEATSMRRFGSFRWEERVAIQQLAHVAGAVMKLQQQGQAQEKASRAERQSASAQLIADAAAGLRLAVERILQISADLAAAFPAAEARTSELRVEALRVSEGMARVAAFSPANSAPMAFDMNALLCELIRFRAPEWSKLDLRVEQRIDANRPVMMLGQKMQIERAVLDLLLHAERHAAAAHKPIERTMAIGCGVLAGRVVVDVKYPAQGPSDVSGLSACRRVAENHSGELRVRPAGEGVILEVDFPAAAVAEPLPPPTNRREGRALTLMLVDGDAVTRKHFLAQLSRRGHRVVTISAEEAAGLASSMRFDSVVWAVRPGGPKWSEYQELLRDSIPAFILVGDGYDQALAASLGEGGGFLLARPVQDAELDSVLEAVALRTAARV